MSNAVRSAFSSLRAFSRVIRGLPMDKQFYSHPVLTNDKPVEVLPLNIAGLRALMKLRADMAAAKEAGTMSPILGIDVFVTLAYHTLSRVLPGLTLDAVEKNLDSSDMAKLLPLMLAVNGMEGSANPPKSGA